MVGDSNFKRRLFPRIQNNDEPAMFFNAVDDKLYLFLEEPAPLYFSVQIEPERTQCRLYHVRYGEFGVEFIVTTLFHLHWKLEHEGRE